MSKIVVRIDDTEVLAAFKALREHAERALEEAGRAAAKVVVDAANDNAVRPVVEAQVSKSGPRRVDVQIGVPREYYYVAIFETGAQPHEVDIQKRKTLFFWGDVGDVFTKSVDHPGVAARPFLRPALDENQDEAARIAGDVLVRFKV